MNFDHQRRLVHSIIKKHSGKPVEEQRRLVLAALGLDPYLKDDELGISGRELVHEVDRRAAIADRIAARRARRNSIGRRYESHRRIIATRIRDERELQYHATKGPRSYRKVA